MKSLIHIYAAQCHIFAEQHGGIMFEATPKDGSQMITACIEHMDDNIVKITDKVIELKYFIVMQIFYGSQCCSLIRSSYFDNVIMLFSVV